MTFVTYFYKRSSRKVGSTLNYLTSLRGIAAIIVVIYHVKEHFLDSRVPRALAAVYENGYLGVDFFFVLSGFIISYKYYDYFSTNLSAENLKSFLVKRFARIYPLHVFMLALFLLIPLVLFATGRPIYTSDYSPTSFIYKLFLADSWHLGKDHWEAWNTPSWTISAEFAAYLIFPLYAIIIGRGKKLGTIFLLSVALTIYIITYEATGSKNIGDNIGETGLSRCLTEFLFGVVIANVYRTDKAKVYLPILSITLLILFLTLWNLNLKNQYFIPLVFSSVLCFLLATYTPLHKFLELKPLVFLGEISYSIYLSHIFFRNTLAMLILENGEKGNIAYLVLYFSTTLLFSVVTYFLIEKRCRKKIVNLTLIKS